MVTLITILVVYALEAIYIDVLLTYYVIL